MVAALDQTVSHLGAGVERVGDKLEGLLNTGGTKQMDHLVEQGAPIAVAPDEPLMDAAGLGTAKTLLAAFMRMHTDCSEWPMMNSGLLESET